MIDLVLVLLPQSPFLLLLSLVFIDHGLSVVEDIVQQLHPSLLSFPPDLLFPLLLFQPLVLDQPVEFFLIGHHFHVFVLYSLQDSFGLLSLLLLHKLLILCQLLFLLEDSVDHLLVSDLLQPELFFFESLGPLVLLLENFVRILTSFD